jgi:small-conductance mechanosensitive channel
MTLTKSFYATLAGLMVAQNTFAAAASTFFGQDKANGLKTDGATDPYTAITKVITQLLTLITIIAVAYCLWAGFQIMTAGGDEEKVKSGRKTIINVLIGIVVMWLAYFIVSFVLQALIG